MWLGSTDEAGILQCTTDPVAADSYFVGGVAISAAGETHITETPSDIFVNGFMVSETGQLVVEIDGVVAGSHLGIPRTAAGAVVAISSAPADSDPFVGGLRVGNSGLFIVGGAVVWTPAALFASSEQGVWYDPSDFSTMFQDSAGTTPVTAVGQPVGLILDKSQGLVLGADQITNGSFTTDTGWNKSAGVTISGGTCNFSAADGTSVLYQNATIVANTKYKITLDATVVSGTFQIGLNGTPTVLTEPIISSGTITCYLTGSSPNGNISITAQSFTGSIDNFTCKVIAGNHATQATDAARPLLDTANLINYDAVDDALVSSNPDLGTDVTIARATAGGVTFLTGQTVGANRSDNTDYYGLVIVNRALTAGETADLTTYLGGFIP